MTAGAVLVFTYDTKPQTKKCTKLQELVQLLPTEPEKSIAWKNYYFYMEN